MEMFSGILIWTSSKERSEIAERFSVTSRQQISRVIRGKSINFPLLQALMDRAEKNKSLYDRNKTLIEARHGAAA